MSSRSSRRPRSLSSSCTATTRRTRRSGPLDVYGSDLASRSPSARRSRPASSSAGSRSARMRVAVDRRSAALLGALRDLVLLDARRAADEAPDQRRRRSSSTPCSRRRSCCSSAGRSTSTASSPSSSRGPARPPSSGRSCSSGSSTTRCAAARAAARAAGGVVPRPPGPRLVHRRRARDRPLRRSRSAIRRRARRRADRRRRDRGDARRVGLRLPRVSPRRGRVVIVGRHLGTLNLRAAARDRAPSLPSSRGGVLVLRGSDVTNYLGWLGVTKPDTDVGRVGRPDGLAADDAAWIGLPDVEGPPDPRDRVRALELRLRALPRGDEAQVPEPAAGGVPVAAEPVGRAELRGSSCSPTPASSASCSASRRSSPASGSRCAPPGEARSPASSAAGLILVAAGTWNAIGIVAGIPLDAVTWLGLGLAGVARR